MGILRGFCLHEAASPPIWGYHPLQALFRLVQEPVKPALIYHDFMPPPLSTWKRERTPLCFHLFPVPVRPALFVVTTLGFGREHAHRCTHPLPPACSIVSSLAGYPQTCEDSSSEAQAQQQGHISLCCRGTGRAGDTTDPPSAKSPHASSLTLTKIAVLVKNHLIKWHCFFFLTWRVTWVF